MVVRRLGRPNNEGGSAMATIRALVTASGAPGGMEIREVPEPDPAPDEALVAVRAVSLNRGEVRTARTSPDGARPGWDVAGEVVASAADGSGPAVGTRVVGLVRTGAWAERVAVQTSMMAAIPDELRYAEAS